MQIPENFALKIERGSAGLWYITSPEIKGLFVAERTMSDALGAVSKTLADMMSADAH